MNSTDNEIIALERQALDRWGNGDPAGFTERYAPGITYFDPSTASRIDGHQAMVDYYRPYVGQISIERYEMLDPQVIVEGNMALLSYNLVNYARDDHGAEIVETRWNSTTVYRRTESVWRIEHSHWSFTRHPALQEMTPSSAESHSVREAESRG